MNDGASKVDTNGCVNQNAASHPGYADIRPASQRTRLSTFEWIGCTVSIFVWGGVAYVALTERAIMLGAGKFGLGRGHSEGAGAIATGFLALGAAAAGIDRLFRLGRYRRLLRLALFICG